MQDELECILKAKNCETEFNYGNECKGAYSFA